MDADAVSLEELVRDGIVVQQAVGGDGAVQFQATVGADDDDDDDGEDEAPAGDVAPSATPIPDAVLMPPPPPPPRSKSGKEPVTATGYQAPPDSDRVTKVSSKRSREASGGSSKDKAGKRRREQATSGSRGRSTRGVSLSDPALEAALGVEETDAAAEEHRMVVGKSKIQDVGFVEEVIDCLGYGAVDRVKFQTSTDEENERDLFRHCVRVSLTCTLFTDSGRRDVLFVFFFFFFFTWSTNFFPFVFSLYTT